MIRLANRGAFALGTGLVLAALLLLAAPFGVVVDGGTMGDVHAASADSTPTDAFSGTDARTPPDSSLAEVRVPNAVDASETWPPTGEVRLLTGELVTVVDDKGAMTHDGEPVRYVETATRSYLIPSGVDPETYDRSLFDVEVLLAYDDGDAVPVVLETEASPAELAESGVRNVRQLASAGVVAAEVEVGPGGDSLSRLVADGTVTRVALDGRVDPATTSEPATWSDVERGDLTGDGVTVAILDSGIDATHPALAGRVVDRVDLVGGRDGDWDEPLDAHGHGTHVAGIVAGTGEDGTRVGVAPGASLVDIRVVNDRGGGRTSTVIQGVEYAVEEAGADVILLSVGSSVDGSRELAKSVEWATERGVVVVSVVGNKGNTRAVGAPGRPSGVITVGATDGDGRVAPYSARGPTLDGRLKPELVAPGDRVLGPRSVDADGVSVDDEELYTRASGTSVAAPQVAGAVALLLEAEPELTAQEVENRLASAARPIDGASPYAQGGGELDVERALDPDVVVHDSVVDFGLVESGGTVTRTITVENRDDRRHELSFESSVRNEDLDVDANGVAWLDRTELSLAPGERADLAMTIDADVPSGAYAGSLRYDVDGEPRSVVFGFVRGGTVTVEKLPLTEGESVDGDDLLVLTEEGTHDELLEFENGTASFVAGGGTYVLWSSRTDEATGTLVMLSERRSFDGPTHVVLDEAKTVPVGVDVEQLEARYGPLANVSVVASMSTGQGDGTARLSVSKHEVDGRTIRFSPDPDLDVATTFLLAPDHRGTAPLDVGDVFHLVHGVEGVDGPSVVEVGQADLATTVHRYHRTTVDETYRIQDRATIDAVWNYRPLRWFDLGHRAVQRIHRLPTGASYTRTVEGDGWTAGLVVTDGITDVLAHPMLGLVESVDVVDGNATVSAAPFADGVGTSLDPPGSHSIVVSVNGEVFDERPVVGGSVTIDGIAISPGDDIGVRLVGDNADGRLSTATVTEVSVVGYDPRGDTDPFVENRPPLVTNVAVEGADTSNAVPPGEITAAFDVERLGSVVNPTVWYAVGAPDEPPWENRSAWKRAETDLHDDRLLATFEVDGDAETVSLAAELRTIHGHETRTMTSRAVHVGEAPNTSTAVVRGRLLVADGTPAASDTILVDPVDGGSTEAVRVGDDGRFELEVPRDRAYDLRYVHGEPWTLRASVEADRPAWLSVGRFVVDDDVDLGDRTLPPGRPLDVRVVDERGEPVGDATVGLTHDEGTVSTSAVLSTSGDGMATLSGADTTGIGLAGPIGIEVRPPDDDLYPEQVHRTSVTLDEPTTVNVTIETRDPDARLTAIGLFREGDQVTLAADRSDVPAGVVEYRWDLNGDGVADRITEESRIRYDPDEWSRTPTLTVVDAAGKTDDSTVTVPVRDR